MSKIKAAAIQMKCSTNPKESLSHAEEMVREAAANGANVILLPELFEREYFCQQRRYDFYQYAKTVEENKAVQMCRVLHLKCSFLEFLFRNWRRLPLLVMVFWLLIYSIVLFYSTPENL